jgi:hypothetical protein
LLQELEGPALLDLIVDRLVRRSVGAKYLYRIWLGLPRVAASTLPMAAKAARSIAVTIAVAGASVRLNKPLHIASEAVVR